MIVVEAALVSGTTLRMRQERFRYDAGDAPRRPGRRAGRAGPPARLRPPATGSKSPPCSPPTGKGSFSPLWGGGAARPEAGPASSRAATPRAPLRPPPRRPNLPQPAGALRPRRRHVLVGAGRHDHRRRVPRARPQLRRRHRRLGVATAGGRSAPSIASSTTPRAATRHRPGAGEPRAAPHGLDASARRGRQDAPAAGHALRAGGHDRRRRGRAGHGRALHDTYAGRPRGGRPAPGRRRDHRHRRQRRPRGVRRVPPALPQGRQPAKRRSATSTRWPSSTTTTRSPSCSNSACPRSARRTRRSCCGWRSNRTHGATAWSFVRRHWDEINERFPSSTIVRMAEGVRFLTDPAVANEVEGFFAEHPVPQGERTMAQHLERLRVNVTLRTWKRSGWQPRWREAESSPGCSRSSPMPCR